MIQCCAMQGYAPTGGGVCPRGGIFFASGLPFWAIARWFFKYVNDREGKNILDVAKEVKDFKDNF